MDKIHSDNNRFTSRTYRFLRGVGNVGTKSLALIGFGTVAYIYYEYNEAIFPVEEKKKAGKKKVLVLPFHRMQIVETKAKELNPFNLAKKTFEDDNNPIKVEVREVVDVIHAASQDPDIVALYGTFGQGFQFNTGGLAHIEEIRNALKVWRESHRVHLTPNLTYDKTIIRSSNGAPKPSYAFADSFMVSDNKGNLEYLIACAFSHIHMQKNGELSLFGVYSTNNFFRSFMDRYGIKAHVFKHGKYKTAPNAFTESDYTREHGMSVRSLVDQLDAYERESIVNGRGAKGFDSMVWKMIRKHGTFTGQQAMKLGLLDHLPKVDPLDKLLAFNNSNKEKESKTTAEMKKKIGNETDIAAFHASEKISFEKYRAQMKEQKRIKKRERRFISLLQKYSDRSSVFESLVNSLGYKEKISSQRKQQEKIAVINLQGTIDDALARKTVASLRKIKKDPKVKAIVLRIDSPGGSVISSETILQECKDISQPIICSMSNVCASGGYYIATGCERIFASPTTITGSIGVFGVKLDLTRLLQKYGINVQSVVTGPHSATYDLFQPINEPIRMNMTQNINRTYEHFKSLVAEGRGMSMKDVEPLAQGKVWTGREAKENGLVDELGGEYRAIEYARRIYTDDSCCEVERWPKSQSILQKIVRVQKKNKDDASSSILETFSSLFTVLPYLLFQQQQHTVPNNNNNENVDSLFQSIITNPASVNALQKGGMFLTIDESQALSHLILETTKKTTHPTSLLDPSLWRS